MALNAESVARNRFKQIIQVSGQPAAIFRDYSADYFTIVGSIIKDGESIPMRVSLGKLGKSKAELLRKMGVNIELETKPSTRHVYIPGVVNAKRTSGYTLLEVAAPTLEEKDKKVAAVEKYLADLGINTKTRCEWVCSADHSKPEEKPIEVVPAAPMTSHKSTQERIIENTNARLAKMNPRTAELRAKFALSKGGSV